MAHARRVAVIGAGWAGCAAAVRLAQQGVRVTLFEAARTLGGRARRVELEGVALDNGQHLLLGAYQRCLALMRTVGIEDNALARLPLQLRYANGPQLQAPVWPAPWHLLWAMLNARGLSWHDKRSLMTFMLRLQRQHWRVAVHLNVAELTQTLTHAARLWVTDPLCISALNTPPQEACAQVFANILRDSLGAKREHSDMLVPQVDLSTLFPDAAARFIQAHGGEVKIGCAVNSITPCNQGFLISETSESFDQIVLATPISRTQDFLKSLHDERLSELLRILEQFCYEPITTVYLNPAQRIRLPAPLIALNSDAQVQHYAQYVFERSDWLALVISAARTVSGLTHDELIDAVTAQLSHALTQDVTPRVARVITEKRATYLCTPGLHRPDVSTPVPGLFLAGDYIAEPDRLTHYPATLESAVRAGERAALAARLGYQQRVSS
jgi:squalene-associated FAD-dependent desaturase